MDTRRGRRPIAELREPAGPLGAADNAAILAKLDAILARQDVLLTEQHEQRRLIHRLAVPVEVVNLPEAARRLSRSTKTVKRLHDRRVFTDGRPPEKRVAGADLVFFADEVEVYRSEGERGVKRLREELGRVQR